MRRGGLHGWPLAVVLAGGLTIGLVAFAPAEAATSRVSIMNFAYAPQTITVQVGDTVTWTNRDTAPHNAAADDGSWNSNPGCSSNSTTSCLSLGQSGSHTFTSAGTFGYHCSVHGFTGTVIVQGPSTTTTAPATTTTSASAPAPSSPPPPPAAVSVQATTTTSPSPSTSSTVATSTSTTSTTLAASTPTTNGETAASVPARSSPGSGSTGLVLTMLAIAVVLAAGGYAIFRKRASRP
jgi:plastocyanin